MSTTPHLYGSHSPVSHPTVRLLIQGEFVDSRSTELHPIVNPATQEVLAQVPMATPEEVDAAVAAARQAFVTWKVTPLAVRMRIMLRFQALLRELPLGVRWLAVQHQLVEVRGLRRLLQPIEADMPEQQCNEAAPPVPGRLVVGIQRRVVQLIQQPHRQRMGVGVALLPIRLFSALVAILEVRVQNKGAPIPRCIAS